MRDFLKPVWDEIDFSQTDQSKNIQVPAQEKEYDKNGTFIDLIPKEKWRIKDKSIVSAILDRVSVRKYLDKSLTLEEISFLLYATQGIKKHFPKYSFRTVPSAGARHTFETYLYADRIQNIPKGLYRYLPIENKLYFLESFKENDVEKLTESLNRQYWNAAVYFIWTTIPYRMEWRYSSASSKLIAIDAGHVCQNLYLACEAIDCGTCGIAAYNQKLIDEFLNVDGKDEFSVYIAPVGKKV